jgi:hypothetical protein
MGRMMRNFIESDKVKELFKQVPPGTVEAIGQSNTPLGNLLKGSGVAYPQQQTQTYAPLVQLQQSLPPLQFDNPERAERIESSLGRAAFGPERIREILMQLKGLSFLANGGRVGMAGGGDIASGLAIRLNRPVQPGDPIGSYYGGTPIMISNKKVEPTLNINSEGRAVNSITGVPLPLSTETTPLSLSTETTPEPLQFDNPERAERIEASLTRAAFGPERIREILMQLKDLNYLADGGRVGYAVGGVTQVIPKNLPLTLNEAINKFGFDAVMGKTIQSGGDESGMYQPGQYTQYYNLMEAQSGGGTGLKEQYRPAIAPVGTILPSKPGTIGYTGPETTTAPVADIAGRRQRIEDSLTRAAFGPERIREILMQLKGLNYLADGGIVSLLKK